MKSEIQQNTHCLLSVSTCRISKRFFRRLEWPLLYTHFAKLKLSLPYSQESVNMTLYSLFVHAHIYCTKLQKPVCTVFDPIATESVEVEDHFNCTLLYSHLHRLRFSSLYQRTLLHMAAEGGHEDILTYLASGLGVDMDIKDENGVSMKNCNGRKISMLWVWVSFVPRHLGKVLIFTVHSLIPSLPRGKGRARARGYTVHVWTINEPHLPKN